MASLVGCYNISYATRDLWISFAFGVIGYFLQKAGYPLVPLVISLVLGLCDHIVVLDSGAVIETGAPAAIRDSERVRHAYMGTAAETDLPVLEVEA